MGRNPGVCVVLGSLRDRDVKLDRLNCKDGSHFHYSRAEALERIKANDAVWIREPRGADRGVLLLRTKAGFRGLSCIVGAGLAVAVDKGELWARVMLADMGIGEDELRRVGISEDELRRLQDGSYQKDDGAPFRTVNA